MITKIKMRILEYQLDKAKLFKARNSQFYLFYKYRNMNFYKKQENYYNENNFR